MHGAGVYSYSEGGREEGKWKEGSVMAASPSTMPMETGRRGSSGRGSFVAAALSAVPMETGRRGCSGRGSFMAAAPTTMPMETGRCRSGERGSLMAAAPSTQPVVCVVCFVELSRLKCVCDKFVLVCLAGLDM